MMREFAKRERGTAMLQPLLLRLRVSLGRYLEEMPSGDTDEILDLQQLRMDAATRR